MADGERDRTRRAPRSARGQASVELLAVLPFLVVCAIAAAHALPAGFALWSAADAAREGARAEHVGRDGERAARGALPGVLRGEGETEEGGNEGGVRASDRGVRVAVRPPSLLPGANAGEIEVETALDPEGEP